MAERLITLVQGRDLRKAGILIILLLLLLTTGTVLAANGPEITRYVLGGGGGRTEAGIYTLSGTVGQAVVGVTSSGPNELCAGFWCGMRIYTIYLPLLFRNS